MFIILPISLTNVIKLSPLPTINGITYQLLKKLEVVFPYRMIDCVQSRLQRLRYCKLRYRFLLNLLTSSLAVVCQELQAGLFFILILIEQIPPYVA